MLGYMMEEIDLAGVPFILLVLLDSGPPVVRGQHSDMSRQLMDIAVAEATTLASFPLGSVICHDSTTGPMLRLIGIDRVQSLPRAQKG